MCQPGSLLAGLSVRNPKESLTPRRATEEDVVEVTLQDKPGSPGRLASKLGQAGVNIEYAYSGTARSAQKVNTYFKVSDLNTALKALRQRRNQWKTPSARLLTTSGTLAWPPCS
jgi:hypothetical protein